MKRVVATATGDSRFYLTLLAGFSCLALVLAAVGIYAVTSYFVSRRTHEIGIRMALGAKRENVLRLVISSALILATTGIAIGLGGALLLTRLMSGLLYGIRPGDPTTFVATVIVLGVLAFAGSYIPARRAAKVDPMVALRYE
jgi:putative ABC transport system permease protein